VLAKCMRCKERKDPKKDFGFRLNGKRKENCFVCEEERENNVVTSLPTRTLKTSQEWLLKRW